MRTRIRKMAETALKGLGYSDCELSLVLSDNGYIRELNREYRGIDRATDVLSFPLEDDFMLGDVVISVEKAITQAGEFGVSLDEELGRLLVHGTLHLIGFDHVKGGWQARRMKIKEDELMEVLKEKGCF